MRTVIRAAFLELLLLAATARADVLPPVQVLAPVDGSAAVLRIDRIPAYGSVQLLRIHLPDIADAEESEDTAIHPFAVTLLAPAERVVGRRARNPVERRHDRLLDTMRLNI